MAPRHLPSEAGHGVVRDGLAGLRRGLRGSLSEPRPGLGDPLPCSRALRPPRQDGGDWPCSLPCLGLSRWVPAEPPACGDSSPEDWGQWGPLLLPPGALYADVQDPGRVLAEQAGGAGSRAHLSWGRERPAWIPRASWGLPWGSRVLGCPSPAGGGLRSGLSQAPWEGHWPLVTHGHSPHLCPHSPLRPSRRHFPRVMPLSKPGRRGSPGRRVPVWASHAWPSVVLQGHSCPLASWHLPAPLLALRGPHRVGAPFQSRGHRGTSGRLPAAGDEGRGLPGGLGPVN